MEKGADNGRGTTEIIGFPWLRAGCTETGSHHEEQQELRRRQRTQRQWHFMGTHVRARVMKNAPDYDDRRKQNGNSITRH